MFCASSLPLAVLLQERLTSKCSTVPYFALVVFFQLVSLKFCHEHLTLLFPQIFHSKHIRNELSARPSVYKTLVEYCRLPTPEYLSFFCLFHTILTINYIEK